MTGPKFHRNQHVQVRLSASIVRCTIMHETEWFWRHRYLVLPDDGGDMFEVDESKITAGEPAEKGGRR